jgi:class 3 adenylate cyclase
MPELDGYQVLAELKADAHLREIPVIMTSSLDELDSVVKCVEMGAEDYLSKPINPVLLNARITASLEKKRLRDQQRELISKFATREVADDLLTSGFSLGGKHVDASAMFCDIRSFTTIAEAREPDETIELLNDYYTLMMDAISAEGGIVNQMVGDGLMSIFGAPWPGMTIGGEPCSQPGRWSISSACSTTNGRRGTRCRSRSGSGSRRGGSSRATRARSTERRTRASATRSTSPPASSHTRKS